MEDLNQTQPESLRELGKGIAVRAGILAIGGLVVTGGILTLAAKTAAGVFKILTGGVLLAAGAGVVAWELRKVRRHFEHGDTHPRLQAVPDNAELRA